MTLPTERRLYELLALLPSSERETARGLLARILRSRDYWREMAMAPPALPLDDVIAALASRADHPDGLAPSPVDATWPPYPALDDPTPVDPPDADGDTDGDDPPR